MVTNRFGLQGTTISTTRFLLRSDFNEEDVQMEPVGGGDTGGMRCEDACGAGPKTIAVLEAAGSCCGTGDLGFLPKIS
ncbi:hypothetical protein PVK06_027191 [Gossypium arboreum]|uniref:Uncharacterized protein n=1 Tax=Gossypium arboreum TaxID=29729 RepID=A0ABR0NZY4_GOSAR|nr:hypothetical protein PVK06_027191 [Gossypium arboreum]